MTNPSIGVANGEGTELDSVGRKPSSWDEARDLTNGFFRTQIAASLVKLGIIDLVGRSGISMNRLISATPTSIDLARRLVAAGVAIRVLELAGSLVRLSSVGEYFLRDREKSLHYNLRFRAHPAYWRAWAGLEKGLRNSRVPFEIENGVKFLEFCDDVPEFGDLFDRAMQEGTEAHLSEFVGALGLQGREGVVDVGGGTGSVLLHALQRYPSITGTLCDRPAAIEKAGRINQDYGGRLTLKPCDFFERLDVIGEVVLLKNVLHDWSDSLASRLLENVHRSLPEARIVIIDHICSEVPSWPAVSDLNTWVLSEGRERSEKDFRRLIAKAGLRVHDIKTLPSGRSAITCSAMYSI